MKTIALGTPARQKIEALKNDPSRCQTVSNGRPLTYDLSCVINRSQSVEVGRVEKNKNTKNINRQVDRRGGGNNMDPTKYRCYDVPKS